MDLISLRNAEARKLGLSYGKYMALVRDGLIRTEIAPEPAKGAKGAKDAKEETEPEYELGTAVCAICGKEFPMRTSKSRTCGPECRAELNRQRNRERYRRKNQGCDPKKECNVCGRIFIPKRMGTLYCRTNAGKAQPQCGAENYPRGRGQSSAHGAARTFRRNTEARNIAEKAATTPPKGA